MFISGLHSRKGHSDCGWPERGQEKEASQPVRTTSAKSIWQEARTQKRGLDNIETCAPDSTTAKKKKVNITAITTKKQCSIVILCLQWCCHSNVLATINCVFWMTLHNWFCSVCITAA